MSDTEPPTCGPEATGEPLQSSAKVERTQIVEQVAYFPEKLAKSLLSRKRGNSAAHYWCLLEVKTVSVTDMKDGKSMTFDGVVLESVQRGCH